MKLSKIASIILGGSLIIAATGCGWWDDDDNGGGSSSTVSTVSTVSGSTLAAYRTGANVIAVGDTNETFTENDGEYTFKVTKPANFTYIQVSGGINSETNTTVPYVSKALAEDYRFVSPLTTLVHDANDTMRAKLRSELGDALSIDYNDVNVTGDKLKVVKKALVVKLAVEKVLAEKGAVEVPKKIYEALEEVDLSDVNTTVAEELVTKIATKIPEANLSEINSSIISIAKADTPDAIEGNYTKAEETVVESTVKLGWNRVNFGDIKVIQATPSTFVPVKIGTDKNITDFYNVSIDFNKYDVKYLKDLAANKTYEANLTITIKEDPAVSDPETRWVTLKILKALITLDANASEPVTVEFRKGITKLYAASSEDLTALYGIVGGGTYADIDDMKNYGDFEFNVNTILDKLTSNKDKINKAIEALNDYLKQDGTYDVTVSLDVNSTDLNKTLITQKITGKVIVNSSDNRPPKISDVEVYVDGNESDFTQIDKNKTFYVNIDANDTDGDPLTAYLYVNGTLSKESKCYNENNGYECYFDVTAPEVSKDTQYTYSVKVCDVYGACSDEYKKTVTVKAGKVSNYDTSLVAPNNVGPDNAVAGLYIKDYNKTINSFKVEFNKQDPNDTTTKTYDSTTAKYVEVKVYNSENAWVGTINMVAEYEGQKFKFSSQNKERTITIDNSQEEGKSINENVIYVQLP